LPTPARTRTVGRMIDDRIPAILVPGVVLPAALAYGSLLDALGGEVEMVAKDLELYAGDAPPPGYAIDVEVDGILRAAEEAGFERFHLVGYSGGGAASLALAARHPEHLRSLALAEPAWAGSWDLSPEEEALWRRFFELPDAGLSQDELMAEFVCMQLRPGVEPPPPPPGPEPPWMAKRPAGIKALIAAFRGGGLDRRRLGSFDRPVYFARGELSNPDYWERMSERLARVFRDFTAEVYEGRHHFDPPHRAEPERFAAALRSHWARADAART
jgi:pimeloyl-ACP methyl ester carboxylesterase